MRRIKFAFVGLFAVLAALWLMADTLFPEPFGYFPFRTVFVQLTGVLAFGAMSVAVVLALRPTQIEPHLGGLDKMYRLHKSLGIAALVIAIVHWWWVQGTRWMVGWGWLERPARAPRPSGGETEAASLETWLRGQRGLAENIGEWAFYAFVVLVVISLWKRIPYHVFSLTHRLMAVVFLILAYHAVVLTKFAYWAQPVGWVIALLIAAGVAGSIISLFGLIGANRKAKGAVESLVLYPELRVTETCVRMREGWHGHKPGQFAFVTATRGEGPHPYTIASAWDTETRRIVFITKALGDFTGRLPQELRADMEVTVEGPYGCFTFDDDQPRQIWIGAGIGVTPFIARMKHLARNPDGKQIDLFHPTADESAEALAKLAADAKAAGVRLHVLISPRDGVFTGDDIRAKVPEWRSASIWFCGPPAFGQNLRADFLAQGLPAERFHQELFQMR